MIQFSKSYHTAGFQEKNNNFGSSEYQLMELFSPERLKVYFTLDYSTSQKLDLKIGETHWHAQAKSLLWWNRVC